MLYMWYVRACVHAKMCCIQLLWPYEPWPAKLLYVHGILQARIVEWVAIPSSREFSQSSDQIHVSCIGKQVFYH